MDINLVPAKYYYSYSQFIRCNYYYYYYYDYYYYYLVKSTKISVDFNMQFEVKERTVFVLSLIQAIYCIFNPDNINHVPLCG